MAYYYYNIIIIVVETVVHDVGYPAKSSKLADIGLFTLEARFLFNVLTNIIINKGEGLKCGRLGLRDVM